MQTDPTSTATLDAPGGGIHPEDAGLLKRSRELFEAQQQKIFRDTDRLFAYLLIFQYAACVVWADVASPSTWSGDVPSVHPHLVTAILMGAALVILPVWLAFSASGRFSTRLVITIAQMLFSSLLIHVSGGRIETHFHVFGSLAFIAFYRDWKLFVPATVVVVSDHLIRGLYFPESVYGVLNASPWRTLEHAMWVVFEEIFLIRSCLRATAEMHQLAGQQAELEMHNALILAKVRQRTDERNQSRDAVKGLERVLGVIGHELRTPLASIQMMSEFMLGAPDRSAEEFSEFLGMVHQEAVQMANDLNKLLEVSRLNASTSKWTWSQINISESCKKAVEAVLPMVDQQKIKIAVEVTPSELNMKGDSEAISRMLISLLENACQHTIMGSILVRAVGTEIQPGSDEEAQNASMKFEISDTGSGIDPNILDRLGLPFALNQGMMGSDHVHGSGLGLAICRGIAGAHGGKLSLHSALGKGTTVTVMLRTDLTGPAPAEQIINFLHTRSS